MHDAHLPWMLNTLLPAQSALLQLRQEGGAMELLGYFETHLHTGPPPGLLGV